MQNFRESSGWWTAGTTAVWGCSLLAILQIQYLPIDSRHSVCGPWGCGPPLPPLIAYHGFWFVLLSLPAILACCGLEPLQLRRVGWIVLASGLVGLIGVGIWDAIPALPHWLPRVANMPTKYIVHRYLLAATTLVDVPLVQITLAGIACLVTAWTRNKSDDLQPTNRTSVAIRDDVTVPSGNE